jgi:hypothetical protein
MQRPQPNRVTITRLAASAVLEIYLADPALERDLKWASEDFGILIQVPWTWLWYLIIKPEYYVDQVREYLIAELQERTEQNINDSTL